MKFTLLLLVFLLYNQCLAQDTQSDKNSPEDINLSDQTYKQQKVLVSEICLPRFNFKDDFITGHTVKFITSKQIEGLNTNSINRYEANLQGVTKNHYYIFRINLGNPENLSMYTVLNNEETKHEFMFERDFTKYSEDWSNWEKPNYMFIEGNLNLLKPFTKITEFQEKETPKVRFKLMTFEEYIKLVRTKKNNYLIKNLENCN